MKSRISLGVSGLLLAFCWNCNQRTNNGSAYTLNGTINGINSGWVYVRHWQTNKTDSARIEEGRFVMKGTLSGPEFCVLGAGSVRRRESYFGFFLQPGEMKLTGHKDSLDVVTVSFEGSPVQDEFKEFQKKIGPIDQLTNQIEATVENSSRPDSLYRRLSELDSARKEMIWQYSLAHPDSYVSAFEAYYYLTAPNDLPRLDSMYSRMGPELKKWYYAEKINRWLQENTLARKEDSARM